MKQSRSWESSGLKFKVIQSKFSELSMYNAAVSTDYVATDSTISDSTVEAKEGLTESAVASPATALEGFHMSESVG